MLTKVRLSLKAEAARSYLSYAWWFLEPALHVTVLYIVFNNFLARNVDNFIVFLVCGQIPYLWFSRSVSNCMSSIVQARGLIGQMHIPKSFFPTVVIFQDMFKSMLVFIVMILFIILNGIDPQITWISLPLIITAQVLVISVFAFTAAMIVPFIPDFRFIIVSGLMLMTFASGIFYDYRQVILPEHQDLFLLNPMANLLRMYRDVLMAGDWPDWGSLFSLMGLYTVLLIIVLKVLHRIDRLYPRIILQ